MALGRTTFYLKLTSFWLFIWFIQSLLMSGGEHLSFYLVKNMAIVGLQFLVVTINLKWLFPRFFRKKRFVLYVGLGFILVYLVFAISFRLIDILMGLFFDFYFSPNDTWLFSFDFWTILSGSSLYSLAFLCSALFALFKQHQLNVKTTEPKVKEVIQLKEGSTTHLVQLEDVLYVKGLKEYVVWQTINQKIVVLGTLKKIDETYSDKGFMRVHKSYIINTFRVTTFNNNSVLLDDIEVPIGRTYKKEIHAYLSNHLEWTTLP